MTGWAPAGIALGISVSGLHDDSVPPSSGPLPTANAEVPAWTALVTKARQGARRYLEQAVIVRAADAGRLRIRIADDAGIDVRGLPLGGADTAR